MTTDLRALALHLATALDIHAGTCRANGVTMPDELRAVAALAWSVAKGDHGGPQGPNVALPAGPAHPAPMLLTIAEAAEALRLSERKVKRLVANGTIASVLIDSARRIRVDDLAAYVDSLGPRPFRDRIEAKHAPASPPYGLAGRRVGRAGGRAAAGAPASPPPRGAA